MNIFKSMLLSLTLLAGGMSSSFAATVSYQYVGNPLTTYDSPKASQFLADATSLSALITFDQPITNGTAVASNIVGLSISDGARSYALKDFFVLLAEFKFVNGAISSWAFAAFQAGPIYEINNTATSTIDQIVLQAGPGALFSKSVSNNPGIWSMQTNATPVPEPETFALLAFGMSLVGVVARRRPSVSRAM